MDMELLQRLIERAMADKEFRQSLLANPSSTLIQWGFTSDQAAQLVALLEEGAPFEELDERVSKYLFGGGGGDTLIGPSV